MAELVFNATIERFGSMGEKTGWSYIRIPASHAERLKPGTRKSFRVKGMLDGYAISAVALLPVGDGDFIMPLNAGMRRGIGKSKGASLTVRIVPDDTSYELNRDFMECLADDPGASEYFSTLARSMQNYFSKWIESEKTDNTRITRIAQSVSALSRRMNYSEMIRDLQMKKNESES